MEGNFEKREESDGLVQPSHIDNTDHLEQTTSDPSPPIEYHEGYVSYRSFQFLGVFVVRYTWKVYKLVTNCQVYLVGLLRVYSRVVTPVESAAGSNS